MSLIYLDHASTTPLNPKVKQTMLDTITDDYAFFNSSSYTYEQAELVRLKIERSREDIAKTLSVLAREIIFTSGATESNNLAIKGTATSYKNKGNHIITSKAEHKSVLDVCLFLENEGFKITYLNVNKFGEVDIDQLKNSITEQTILVSLMAVNNELGTKNNLLEISNIIRGKDIIFHVDFSQCYGKIGINIKEINIDLLSVSGHKLSAPKGIGFLYVRSKRPKVKLVKQIHGGSQEFNLRAGTLANYQIFALSVACKEMFAKIHKNLEYIIEMRNQFLSIIYQIEDIQLNTNLDNSYPGILSITFLGIKGETLLAMLILDNICLSMGSACNSQLIEPSHVLTAIGLTPNEAASTIRVSFGLENTRQEVIKAASIIKQKVELLRLLAPKREKNV